MRGSSWATDWPKAVRGLHELAHAADRPLRKGGGLRFLPAQEKQESERNAVSKCGQNRHGHRSGRSRVLPAASRCAVPLRLATLASGEPRSEKHSHTRMGLREYPSMREHQEIISREHIRVARNELPWVDCKRNFQPHRGCIFFAPTGCNPFRVDDVCFTISQGSSRLATLICSLDMISWCSLMLGYSLSPIRVL